MSNRLAHKTAFVTGGGSGIGQAICLLFAQEGANVVVFDRIAERSRETAAQIAALQQGKAQGRIIGTALPIEGDVTSSYDIARATDAALDRFGNIDILINNAAISVGNDILTIDEETWDLNLDVVLKSVFLCCKAVVPVMLKAGSGAIINIASVNGQMGIGEEPYSAAKAGVINFTQNLAVRYGPSQIRANVISPGTIQTPIWQERLAEDPSVLDRLAAWYPLGRVGQPEDIAQAALFLASDAARWITGTVLNVDGGLTAGSYKMSVDLNVGPDDSGESQGPAH